MKAFDKEPKRLPHKWDAAVEASPWTFGAAAKRLVTTKRSKAYV